MQKKLKWFFIILHAITFPSLIVAYYWIIKDPVIHRFLFYMLAIWGTFAIFSPLIYLRILPFLLPRKKTHARMLNKHLLQTTMRSTGFRQGIITPVLIFEFDNGVRNGIPVSWKVFNSFQGGETGTLIYKESGNQLYFVDFIKD